jgi:hypothetical protein
MSKAESKFLQAEAVLHNYYTGDVESLYNAGVIAAFEQLQFNDSIPSQYLMTPGIKYRSDTTVEAQLEMIMIQKWASMAGTHGLEAFFETNRTHYPKESSVPSSDPSYIVGQLSYSVNGATSGQFPKRLLFPDFERDRNPNTPAEVPITTKVWWDKK